jgi:hypothetical protein
MKKIGLLSLALILALGTLGVGYAMWTDTVTVTGTVHTGTVQVGILDVGTNDPGPGQYFLPDEPLQDGFSFDPLVQPVDPWQGPPFYYLGDKDVASCNSYNIGDVKCICNDVGYYAAVSEVVDHAYPFYAPTMHLQIASCGTVPVKIDSVEMIDVVDPDGVLECIVWGWEIYPPEAGVGPVIGSGTLEEFVTALDHFQIEECEVMDIYLTEIFLECTPQGKTATFDLTITASQWNEVNGS